MVRQALTTEIVVDTATDIANAEGLDAITLTRVAKHLDASQPALYRHVDNYDALIRLLGLRGRDVLFTRLTESAVGLSGDDAVKAMGRAWRQTVKDVPGLYAATDRYPCAGDHELEAAVDRIVNLLGQALISFDLSDDDRVHAARTLRSAFHGFAHLEAGDGHPLEQDLDETFEHLLDLLCAGISRLAGNSR
ncbi:MAG: WHG domain-containing protein [Acidimicrobiia bacterium]|nr:WHG domain-containing protein [Acidimicrobiia bacterium]